MNPPAPLSSRSERTGVVCAVVAGGIATIALLGWALPVPELVQIEPTYPPIYANAAVGLLAAAVALYGVARGRSGWLPGIAGGALALLIGAATLYEYATGASLHIDELLFQTGRLFPAQEAYSGRMPAVSAFNLVLVGVSLLTFHLPRWRAVWHVLTGTMGTIIAALALAVLLSYTTGVLSSLRGGTLIGLSIHSAICFALLGSALIVVSWRRDSDLAALPSWVPASVGLAMLITTGLLWRALLSAERTTAESRLATLAQVVHHKAAADLDEVVGTLRRQSAWLAERGGTPLADATWLGTAGRIVSDNPGLGALLWYDSTGVVRTAGREPPGRFGGTLAAEAELARRLPEWPESHNPLGFQSWLTRDDAGEPLLSLVVPVCDARRCTGFIGGLLHPEMFFGAAIGGLTPGYAASISAENQLLYRSEEPRRLPDRRLTVQSSFESAGLAWNIVFWPNEVTAISFVSDLPVVVAGLGTAVSLLLALSLRLLQTTDASARATERARLASGVESATDGLWERNHLTGQSSRSAAVWRRLGYDPAEVAAPGSVISWQSLVHPEDRPVFDAQLREHAAGTIDALDIEYRIRAKDGDWHWMVDRGRVVERDDHGKPRFTLGLCADVTERKRFDQALAASEQRFRTMFDRGFQLEQLLDVNAHLLEANGTSLAFAGTTIDEVRGKPFWDTPWWTGNPAAQERLKAAFQDALRGKTVRYQVDVKGGGSKVTLMDFSLTPIIDREGRVIQILAEGRDISERQRVEDAMRELDTLSTMGRLAARVAHEINNPLAGIQNSFLLIKGAIPASHPYFSYVGAIEREITRMAGITRQLYETYRPDGDNTEGAPVPVLISDAVQMLQQVNRASNVRIEVDTTGSPPVIPVPGALLRQAVYNLVQNAVEATPPGGVVRVTAWRTDHTFWLSVVDEGKGVPVASRERIFEPFVTTKGGLKTGGMGLGLSLVKRSVQALGGKIELYDPPDGGAEFRIAIPLR